MLGVLASYARIRLLQALRRGAKTGVELQQELGLDTSVVSRHLTTLRRAGLVRGEKHGNTVHYCIADERVFDLLELAHRILNTRVEKEHTTLGGPQPWN